nr:unnamed protein product [Digitaria exilis]
MIILRLPAAEDWVAPRAGRSWLALDQAGLAGGGDGVCSSSDLSMGRETRSAGRGSLWVTTAQSGSGSRECRRGRGVSL